MGAFLTQKMGIRILMVEYRTAPKHPFPAALEDCVTAYHWLLKHDVAAQNIGVAGDSAGGNLTITMLMKLRDRCSRSRRQRLPVAELNDPDAQRKPEPRGH